MLSDNERLSLLERTSEDHEARLLRVEETQHLMLEQSTATCERLGRYEARTDAELVLMRPQLQSALDAVLAIVEREGAAELASRAKRLARRIRNNITRLNKAAAKRVSAADEPQEVVDDVDD